MSTTIMELGHKAVMERTFGITVSDAFYSCANKQLTAFFERETQLKIDYKIYITWDYYQDLGYVKAATSYIFCKLHVGHLKESLKILWKSVSGRIYSLSDTDIDCADIVIWLENLNAPAYHKALFPPNTLFRFHDIAVSSIYTNCGLVVAEAFIACADVQLTSCFERTVGYKINKQVSISIVNKDSEQFIYSKSKISRLSIQIYNNHNWNLVTILWQSKSGRIYDVADTDIDCNDIDFWFEGIDAVLYQKQMYPKNPLPFKLKNLSYELVVERIQTDCSITAALRPDAIGRGRAIGKELTDFVEDFNQKSEAKGRKDGVVHSAYASILEDNILELTLDIGSAGAGFFKKLLMQMSAMGNFDTVNIN